MTKRQDEKDEKDAQEQQRRESQHRVDEAARRQASQREADDIRKEWEGWEQARKAQMEPAATSPAEPEAPKPPPVFSVASRPPVDLSREDGEPLGDIPAPWVYTLIGMDGTIGGALMADAEAEWLDVGPHHLRVEMIPVPSLPRGVPVVFLPNALISEIADPKVSPPDVFSGQTGLAGTAHECLMRNYHSSPVIDPKAASKTEKAKVARRVVYADPSKPAPKPSQKVTNAA
jgi:hypothetical protein